MKNNILTQEFLTSLGIKSILKNSYNTFINFAPYTNFNILINFNTISTIRPKIFINEEFNTIVLEIEYEDDKSISLSLEKYNFPLTTTQVANYSIHKSSLSSLDIEDLAEQKDFDSSALLEKLEKVKSLLEENLQIVREETVESVPEQSYKDFKLVLKNLEILLTNI